MSWAGTGAAYPVLLDPSWQSTGSLSVGRSTHAAVLLADGRVLVAGGFGGAMGDLASAEVSDPASGTFSVTASLSTPQEHDLTPGGPLEESARSRSAGRRHALVFRRDIYSYVRKEEP